MDPKKPTDCSYAEKRKAAMQLKRRNTYSQVSAHKREALLLSRHVETDSTRHNLVENLSIAAPTQPTSSCYRDVFPKQVALIIREPQTLPEKAVNRYVRPTQPQDNLDKAKQACHPLTISQTTASHEIRAPQILDNLSKRKQICSPFTIFETGCTSAAPAQHLPTLNTVPTKGHRRTKKKPLLLQNNEASI